MNKPYSAACEQNKHVILNVIAPHLEQCRQVLEIGSGTGQHALHFANHLPHLIWQTSDLGENTRTMRGWLAEGRHGNLPDPLDLDVASEDWGIGQYDAVFSANTSHIMNWNQVCSMFRHVARHLLPDGRFFLYGPFNQHGFTSDSNRDFHHYLQSMDSGMGLREIEDLQNAAEECGIILLDLVDMPVNNKILIWGNKTEK